ncbi:MAG TPA: SRPBCC family protein, partial [Gemmatimonadaceae bacterium]|nr:SRPBCC family protein [Gemmatimonadaceae bacterium]
VPRVRGVTDVLNRLRVHESAEGVPSLQGGRARRWNGEGIPSDDTAGEDFSREDGIHAGRTREQWSPAERLLSSVAGGALAWMGARRRGGIGTAVGLTGLALLTRGTTNRRLRTVLGANGRTARAIDVLKTINIRAPVEEVYAALTDWERFPEWMTHVRDVRSSGPRGEIGERTHWVVDGPAGTKVSWEAETTGLVPNEFIGWKSVEGATLRQAGSIRFAPTADGTRVQIQMSYLPPAGAVGHAVAALFGRDPRRQMHDDLARLKTMIETGVPARDAAQPGEASTMDPALRADPSL